ncbi:hypothetical protein PTKIN_Ptkin15bG0118100 [Pterospermum kingtungense]
MKGFKIISSVLSSESVLFNSKVNLAGVLQMRRKGLLLDVGVVQGSGEILRGSDFWMSIVQVKKRMQYQTHKMLRVREIRKMTKTIAPSIHSLKASSKLRSFRVSRETQAR